MVQATKARTSTAVPTPQDPEVASLKSDGDRAFLNKNYKAAADAYESAVKLMSDGLEKAEIQTKAAGAHCLSGRYKEAVKLSTLALENCGSAPLISALKTRAKANEQLGFYKQALSDIQVVNAKHASDETKEQQKRLEVQTGVKQKLNSAPNTRPISAQSSASPSQQQQQQPAGNPYSFIVKATLDGETKIVQSHFMMPYPELYDLVRSKFASAGPVVLKFTDKEGDVITLTSTNDWQMAVAETVTQYQKAMQAGAPKLSSLPPVRLTVAKVASEADVPKEVVPTPAQQVAAAAAAAKQDQPQETYEIDQWLVDFAGLFTELTGIDPMAHHEHINLGTDKINRILDASLSEEKSVALFDKATEHFKDATSNAIIQWGNTFVVRADRQAQVVLKSGKAIEGKSLDAMLKDYDEAEKKYNEALKTKNDSWEAQAAIGQLEWERAKAKIAFIIPTPTIEEAKEDKTPEQAKEEVNANLLKALAKLDPKKVGSVSKHIENLNKSYDKGYNFAKLAEEKRKAEEEKAEKEGTAIKKPELTEEQLLQQKLASPPSNMLIMWGNALYEWSQVLAAINKSEWRAVLDTATEKFRASGAAETDIRAALKNHTRVADLNLGPDPEPEPAPAPAAAAAAAAPAAAAPASADAEAGKAAPEQAKGLPSLEVKKKPANKA